MSCLHFNAMCCPVGGILVLMYHYHANMFFNQVLANAVDMVELNVLETEFPTDSDAQTDMILHGKKIALF